MIDPTTGLPNTDDVLEWALQYATRGWRVLPIWWIEDGHCACPEGRLCKAGGKHPVGHMVPTGVNSASLDEGTIRAWVAAAPRMNIAVATGAPSGLVVIDLDQRDVGDEFVDGEFEFEAWLAARGVDLPRTMIQATGGGGKHVILDWPLPSTGMRPVISSRVNWLPGVDIRADGGYIVVAPSQHVSGMFYHWDSFGALEAISGDLLGILSTERRQPSATGRVLNAGTGESVDIAVLLAEGFRAGERDDSFTRLAGTLRARGDSLPAAKAIVEEVWNHTDQPDGDVYSLDTALEKVERGYQQWNPPAQVSDIELAWATWADSKVRRIEIPRDPMPAGPTPALKEVDEDHGDDDDEDEPDRDPAEPIDLVALMLGGTIERDLPTMLRREDGQCLVYAGKLHSIYGEPGHGKTWVALHLVMERLLLGEVVVYLDYDEDDGGMSITRRLKALGCTPERAANLRYLNPQGAGTDPAVWKRMKTSIKSWHPSLLIVDTMAPALVEMGLNEKDNAEVGAWYRHIGDLVRMRNRPAILVIDHVVKSNEGRGRWARGAGDKLGRLHAAYGVDSTVPFSRAMPGQIQLIVAKDRGGDRREGDIAAIVRFTPVNQGEQLQIRIETPSSSAGLAELSARAEADKQAIIDRVVNFMHLEGRLYTRGELKRSVGNSPLFEDALDDALRRQIILESDGHHYAVA